MGNMELLVTSACSLSYLYSFLVFAGASTSCILITCELISFAAIQFGWPPMPDFFDTPVLLMFFVSMGKTIEAKARSVTAHSLSSVGSKSLPETANLVSSTGPIEVPSSSLQVGARVIVAAGCAIPCDGVIVEGSASVNEMSVTGEPLPTLKAPGADVFASCMIVDGSVTVRATRVAGSTTICLLSRLVADAHNGRVTLQVCEFEVLIFSALVTLTFVPQNITDKIASKFVAVILALCFVTFFSWLLLLGSGVVKLEETNFPYPVAASLFAVSLMVIYPSRCSCLSHSFFFPVL
jgi:cation transport ATPase